MSELRANTISDAAGTGPVTLTKQEAPKMRASVVGGTAAVSESLNVSSSSDDGSGTSSLNYITAFAATTYTVLCAQNDAASQVIGTNNEAVGSITVITRTSTSGAATDADYSIANIGDLA